MGFGSGGLYIIFFVLCGCIIKSKYLECWLITAKVRSTSVLYWTMSLILWTKKPLIDNEEFSSFIVCHLLYVLSPLIITQIVNHLITQLHILTDFDKRRQFQFRKKKIFMIQNRNWNNQVNKTEVYNSSWSFQTVNIQIYMASVK